MTTFLLVLGGLIVFNFILLKFSMQSVDKNIKKKAQSARNNHSLADTKAKTVRKAA